MDADITTFQVDFVMSRGVVCVRSVASARTAAIRENILTALPGWESIASVSSYERTFRLAGIVFFALALVIELVAMFVKKYERILQWVGILVFFMCAGAEFISYKYDGRRDALVEEQHQQELGQQKLKTDALQQQLDKAQQKTDKSEQDSEDAKTQAEKSRTDAEEAKRQAAEVKVANEPRRLSDLQKQNIRNLLTGQPTGSAVILAALSATDASDYAKDFAAVLRGAGWKAEIKQVMVIPEGENPPDRGLHVIIKEQQPPFPPATVNLVNALRKANVDIIFQYNPSMSDEIQIVINPK
jgi:hypothetical protein